MQSDDDIENRPDLNTGTKWSEMDLLDLGNCVRLNDSVEEIASFMCRSRREIRKKVAELGRSRKHLALSAAHSGVKFNNPDSSAFTRTRSRSAFWAARCLSISTKAPSRESRFRRHLALSAAHSGVTSNNPDSSAFTRTVEISKAIRPKAKCTFISSPPQQRRVKPNLMGLVAIILPSMGASLQP